MVFLAFAVSLLFLLIVSPFWVSLSTPIMISISGSNGENSEKRTSPYSCLYCKKVFSSHRALGGHLKTHNIEIKSGWRRQPRDCSGIVIGLPSSNTNPLYNNQSKISSGGAASNISWSNQVISMHASKYSESGLKNIKNLFIMSPYFSPSCAINEIHLLNCLSSKAFAPSGRTAVVAAPLDPSFCLALPRVYQFSTGTDQSLGDGMPFFYGGVLQNCDHNLVKPSFSTSTVSKACSSLDLNQLSGFKGTTVGSSFMDSSPCLGHDESGHNKMKSFLSHEKGKRQHSLDSIGNTDLVKASKRPKIDSNLPMEIENIQNKKPLLMKKVEEPFPGLGISIAAEQEVLADLDLSLHL